MSGIGRAQPAGRGAVGRGAGRGRSTPIKPPAQPSLPVRLTQVLDNSAPVASNQIERKILPVSDQFESAVEAAPIPVSLAPTPVQVQAPRPTTQPNLADRFDELAVTKKSASTPLPAHEMVAYKDEKFPAKPKPGTLGTKILLQTNHYRLKMPKEITVYQYDVDLKRSNDLHKDIKNKDIHRDLFRELMKLLGPGYKNKVFYNFSKNLFSFKALPFDEDKRIVKIDNKDYSLKIKKIKVDTYGNFDSEEAIHLLDLMFTHNFQLSCFNVSRCFFRDDCAREALNFDTEIWRGVYASVRPSEVGLTLNLDSANAAFLYAENVLELAFNFYEAQNAVELKKMIEGDRNLKDSKEIGLEFMKMFRGRQIKIENGFRKKIQGFGKDSHHKFDLPDESGKTIKISIADYFKKKYNLTVKNPDLPCIDTGKGALVPMELCKTEAKSKKNLTSDETSTMIKFISKSSALDRQRDIQSWAQSSGIAQDPILKDHGISVDLKMVQLDGRVLPAPEVEYSKNAVVKNIGKSDRTMGQWDHRNHQFMRGMTLNSWVVLNLSKVNPDQAFEFTQKLREIGAKHGMQISKCANYYQLKLRPSEREVQAQFEKAVKENPSLELILVIFPGTDSSYGVCKTLGDLKYGVITQGVEDKNVKFIKDQTLSNILLKMNTKLGGINFYLSQAHPLLIKHLQELYKGPMMCFGADVTHPAPGDPNNKESIAAVVGSLDQHCSVYAARLYAQRSPKGQAYEMIHDLDKMVKSLLQEFKDRNNKFPKRIVFFRDGVSEGQFPLVIRHEMNKIRSACQDVSQGYKPAITFIVVQKRHHTRFFPTRREDQVGKGQNVPPGTVVDTTVVTKVLFDFFLCSHYGIQGTSRPCRYFVLHDDNNFSMDQAQLLSYYLCHIYCRCPRSVSYPAPAYYSHLAAFRGRDYNRGTPRVQADPYGVVSYEIELHDKIKNKMFFT